MLKHIKIKVEITCISILTSLTPITYQMILISDAAH